MVLSCCTTSPTPAPTKTVEASGANSLELILALDKDVYHSGDWIQATMTIKNNGPKRLLVNKRMALNASFAPERQRDISFIITTPSNNKIEFMGLLDVISLTDEEFVPLYGLEGFQTTYPNLDIFFDFSEPGKYTAQVFYENKFDPDDGRTAWKGKLVSNAVEFYIEP
jgi:hypothetical protein